MKKEERLIACCYTRSEVIGSYVEDSYTVQTRMRGTGRDKTFKIDMLPMFGEVYCQTGAELSLMDVGMKGGHILGYSRSNESMVSDEDIERDMLNLTNVSLKVSSDVLVLNMSGRNISTCDRYGTFSEIGNIETSRTNCFSGKIAVVEITKVPLKDALFHSSGIRDAYDAFSNKIEKELFGVEGNKIRDIFNEAGNLYQQTIDDPNNKVKACFGSNTIQVVSVILLDSEKMRVIDTGGQVFVEEYDLLIGDGSMMDLGINPILTKGERYKTSTLGEIEPLIDIYINDKKDKVQNKYISFLGSSLRIPKLRVEYEEEGLYVRGMGYKLTNRVVGDKSFFPMEELDSLDWIYNSEEEALIGGDVLTQREISFREKKLEAELESLKYKMEMQERDHQREMERYEQKVKQEDVKFLRDIDKTELDLLREEFKLKEESRVRDYEIKLERERWEREVARSDNANFVDTLKTTGAIAGVIATGLVIYNKLK